MTKTAGERLTKIETDIDYIKEKQDELCEGLDEFIGSSDSRYASKLSEKIVYGLVAIIIITVIAALIKLVVGA